MILVQWSCEVPQEKLGSFLNYVKNSLKPFYKSHGCLRYELYFPMITSKKYFSYQISEVNNRYTEQLLFKNIKDFNDFYERIEKEQAAQEIIGMYAKEFEIKDCKLKILKQTG